MAEKVNGNCVEEEMMKKHTKGTETETETLPEVLNRMASAILFPEPVNSGLLLRRIKASVADNAPLLPEASRNSAHQVLVWTRQGSPLRALLVISWEQVYLESAVQRIVVCCVPEGCIAPENESIDSLPIGWTVGAMIYFTGEVSGSNPGWPGWAEEKNRRLNHLLYISKVGSVTFVALTGLLVFMLFFLAATINAVVISLLMSVAAAGGFLALFFAFVTAIYVGALSLAIFVITVTTFWAIVAILITTGWIGFFYTVWLVTRKSFGFAKHSLSVTGSAISTYTTARHARHRVHKDSD